MGQPAIKSPESIISTRKRPRGSKVRIFSLLLPVTPLNPVTDTYLSEFKTAKAKKAKKDI
jgi:hypothetical protein